MSRSLPKGVNFRRSAPDDAQGFRSCLDSVARERRWIGFLEAPPLEAVRTFLSTRRLIQFLAVGGAGVLGWCDVTPDPREGFRHLGVLGMGVRKEHRGRGIGSVLLEHTLAAARESGLWRIELEVFESNEGAIRLYEKAGFQLEGRKRKGWVLEGRVEDVLMMALLVP